MGIEMDTLPNDLLRLIQPFLGVDQLIILFNEQQEFCKNIKEAARKTNWKWILYYLEYYKYQKSCILEGYYAAIETQNSKLINDFENLNPEVRNDDCRIKYYAKAGNFEYIDCCLKSNAMTLRYCWYILEGLIKTHNMIGFKKYEHEQLYAEMFNRDYSYLARYIKYAIKYNNDTIVHTLMPIIKTNYQARCDGILWLCQTFLSKFNSPTWYDKHKDYTRRYIYWIAKAGLINICSPYIDKFQENMVQGLLDGQCETILELIKDKHKDNIDLYRTLTKYYIKKRDYEQFKVYFKILITRFKNKHTECADLFEDAVCSNNYRVVRILLLFIKTNVIIWDAYKIKDPHIAMLIAKNKKVGIPDYNILIIQLLERGHNVVANIFDKSR